MKYETKFEFSIYNNDNNNDIKMRKKISNIAKEI